MSEQNVEAVRRLLATFERGLDLDAAAESWHQEIDWRAIEGAPDDVGAFRGHDAMRHYFEQWLETLDDLRAEPEEPPAAGAAAWRQSSAPGRSSG